MVVGLKLNIENFQQLDDAAKEQRTQQSPGEDELLPLAKQGENKSESDSKELDDATTTQSIQQSPGEQGTVHLAKQRGKKDETNRKLTSNFLTD